VEPLLDAMVGRSGDTNYLDLCIDTCQVLTPQMTCRVLVRLQQLYPIQDALLEVLLNDLSNMATWLLPLLYNADAILMNSQQTARLWARLWEQTDPLVPFFHFSWTRHFPPSDPSTRRNYGIFCILVSNPPTTLRCRLRVVAELCKCPRLKHSDDEPCTFSDYWSSTTHPPFGMSTWHALKLWKWKPNPIWSIKCGTVSGMCVGLSMMSPVRMSYCHP
jgi:hypothetical protein